MLVLSREVDQEVVIGEPGQVLTEPIVIMVVAIQKNKKARLGINAQADLPVHRREIHELIKREKLAAIAAKIKGE